MKVRYDESFLFPNSQEDFGRSLVFPQGNLHGLSGLGDAVRDGMVAYYNDVKQKADLYEQRYVQLQNQLEQQSNVAEQQRLGSILTLNEGITFLQTRGLYQQGMRPEEVAATVHAIDNRFYVSGAGMGYGSADALASSNVQLKKDIADAAANFNLFTAEAIAAKQLIDARTPAVIAAQEKQIQDSLKDIAQMRAEAEIIFAQQRAAEAIEAEKLAAKQKADFEAKIAKQLLIDQANAQAVAAQQAQAQADIAAQAAATRAPRVIVNAGQTVDEAIAAAAAAAAAKTVTTTNNTAGTVTTTNPATGTVTTTSPTTGATTTANVVTGAVTVTTPAGQTVSGTGSVTAGNTSTTVNQATGTVTTTNTTTGATTVTNAATGQSQTGTAAPTTYILDFYDNQFWLKTSAGAAVSNGSADFRTPTEYLSRSNITLAQTTLTPAASVKFANNQGVTVQTNSAGGTTTTNPTTGTVTTTNPATGTVTTTNTTTGTTTTTTPATGTTTTTTTPTIDTGKIALLALLGVLLLRGAVR
jgi:hypothetical protein